MVTIPEMLNHSDSSEDGIPNSLKPNRMSRSKVSSSPEDKSPEHRPDSVATNISSSSDSSTPMSSEMSSRPSLSSSSETSSLTSFPPSKMQKILAPHNSAQLRANSARNRPSPTQPESTQSPTTPEDPKSQVPKSKINQKFLTRKLVQIAIRRKSANSAPKFSTADHPNSKLHIKSLEAGLRVKLTLASDMTSLYNALTPHTTRKRLLNVLRNPEDTSSKTVMGNDNYLSDINLSTKPVQLIDNNLVNLSGFSNKVLKSFKLNKTHKTSDSTDNSPLPTFNSLNTAVHSLFGLHEYSLVRITRSTTTDFEGSVLLKFETSMPGDFSLIDDNDFTDDFLHSLGKPHDDPGNLFIKKVVARPRYKSDMKIYIIPGQINCSLYVDKRMLERDLVNGVVDLDSPSAKSIICGFDPQDVVDNYKNLVALTNETSKTSYSSFSASSTNTGYGKQPNQLPPFKPQSQSAAYYGPGHTSVAHGVASDMDNRMPITKNTSGYYPEYSPTKLPPLGNGFK